MNSLLEAGENSRQSVRAAVVAAALAVAGCFGAAMTFAETEAVAAQTEVAR